MQTPDPVISDKSDVLREILERAAALPPRERPAMLDAACGDDRELREQIESLLRALTRGADLLEDPTHTAAQAPVGLEAGSRIGRYQLLQPIGEGGMGVVYLAEQQSPVHRQVALKIIKPGLDSQQVIARFAAERQALA